MAKAGKKIKEVIEFINEIRKDYPQITNDLLLEDGAIYYMNANDGTKFDWYCNDRLCEFYLFYKENEYGFLKVFVNRDNTISGYVYLENGFGTPICINKKEFKNAYSLYTLMLHNADNENKYDQKLEDIFEF